MENEIKVGDWIRDREGHITKIIQTLLLFKDVELYLGEDGYQYSDNAIVKHSSNLIDLIQVGDMVHTKDVLNEDWYWMFDEEMVKATKETIEQGIDLVEIVTKEMMESISYKVETH